MAAVERPLVVALALHPSAAHPAVQQAVQEVGMSGAGAFPGCAAGAFGGGDVLSLLEGLDVDDRRAGRRVHRDFVRRVFQVDEERPDLLPADDAVPGGQHLRPGGH
ncbi:hypothetical protein QRX50_34905 [Amycolatopsis carbonis]|uniref:Uncharacterized protein n=1 Tax=Amycolatopsis carbonis TaxID=715471 RepID=A0A9Y2IB22_9PSEU|nr:hypothetical protein [Amycolatopsis sp. 2-15]WIX76619.1 hypothetical protein QRX50_34905 [Amycolatopsis sp. 2-15]